MLQSNIGWQRVGARNDACNKSEVHVFWKPCTDITHKRKQKSPKTAPTSIRHRKHRQCHNKRCAAQQNAQRIKPTCLCLDVHSQPRVCLWYVSKQQCTSNKTRGDIRLIKTRGDIRLIKNMCGKRRTHIAQVPYAMPRCQHGGGTNNL